MHAFLLWCDSPLAWTLAVPAGFLALLFTVALFERHLTRPFIPAVSSLGDGVHLDYAHITPDPSQLPDYVRAISGRAQAAGFLYGGMLTHAHVPKVKILATIWMSPARDTLVLSGSGTVTNLPRFQTWIYTPLRNGIMLATTDNSDAGEHSGLCSTKHIVKVPFDQLLEGHRRRVEESTSRPDVFRESTPIEALQKFHDRRVQRMIERGVARFRDGGGIYWSYTVKGAFLVCGSFFGQLAGSIPQYRRVSGPPIAPTQLKNKSAR